MSNFNVDTDGLRSAASRCDGISGNISNLGDQIREVRASLYGSIGKYSGVMSALNTCYSNSKRCSTKVNQYGNVGMRIANEYANTENTISGNMKLDKFGNSIVLNSAAKALFPLGAFEYVNKFPVRWPYFSPFIPGGAVVSTLLYYLDVIYDTPDGKAGTKDTIKSKFKEIEGTKYKWDSKTKKWVKEEGKDGKKVNPHTTEYSYKREWDPKTKKWVEPAEKAKKKGFAGMEKEVKLHEWEAKDAPSGKLWEGKGSLEGDYGKLEGSVDVSKWETHANGYVGVMAAGGTVGASYTAFSASGLAQLGDENLGGYVSGTVTVGKVGAEASGSIGLYDKYGNLNPNAKIGASAEAIGGEIKGKAGVKVAGTDIGVTGSLNYGIGAHANIGYSDGKFSVDIGATFGVGGSVKLEIDASGTINAVCDGAKAAWNSFKGLFGH